MDQSLRQSIMNASAVGAVFGGDLAMRYHTRNNPDLPEQGLNVVIGYIPTDVLFPPQYLIKEISWHGHGLQGVPFDVIRAESILHEDINLVRAGHLLAIMVQEWVKADDPMGKTYFEHNIMRLSICVDDVEQYKAFNLMGNAGVATYRKILKAAGLNV